MRKGLKLSIVVVGILLLGGLGIGFAVPRYAAGTDSPPPLPAYTGSSPKFHIVEVLTGVWCPPCGAADPALSRIQDEYADNLLLLAYHCCTLNTGSGNYDPWYETTVLTPRDTFYGFQYLPTAVFDGGGRYTDGTLFKIGSGSTSASYDGYRFPIEDNVDTTSNIALGLSGDLTPTAASARVTITATDPLQPTETNLTLRTVLYVDGLFWNQANGVPYHRNIVVALNEQPFTVSYPGSITLTASFTLNPAWNTAKLGIASFVQSSDRTALNIPSYPGHYGSDILNAAWHNFVPRGVLIHRDRGTVADYSEQYEVLMAQRAEGFDAYNEHVLGTDTGTFDARGLPSGERLNDAAVLIWHTGPTSTSVLDAADRGVIGQYLDGGGNLVITGSNLGADAWSPTTGYRTWFQQYLHAAYEGDDTGYTSVTGVVGDPVSDTFSGTSLGVLGSPDRINAAAGAFVPFGYTATIPGSVRAQHDADSRVVYLGFQYFENTIDTNRVNVLGKILDWMDGTSAPNVDVLYPDGGEQIAQGTGITLRWHATDVRFPTAAVDIYFNDNYPSGPWQPIAMGEPNDGVYQWTLPNVDSANCRIRVVVQDTAPTSADGEAMSDSDFICGAPGFSISFTSADLGWHLISHPLILTDTSIQTVLGSITGAYGAVRYYDASDVNDPWKAYVPGKAGNDLQYMDNTMGIWIQITAPCTLQILGTRPTSPTQVALQTGWNLVGFPSSQSGYSVAQLKADTGATRVEGFDATSGPYYLRAMAETDTLLASRAYWVYVPSATIWAVPA